MSATAGRQPAPDKASKAKTAEAVPHAAAAGLRQGGLDGAHGAHDDDDSHMDQNAEAPPLLQSALLQSVLLDDEDNEAEDAGDFAAVAAAINRLIKAKQGKHQQRQQAILVELQEQVMGQLRDFEAAATKEHKEVEKLVTSTFSSHSKKLTEKFKVIETINAKYQQDLKAAWEEYNTIFTRVEDTKDQTAALLEKRRAGQKRKLAVLQESLADKVTEAEGRLEKLTSSAVKQRNITDVLKCLMPAADADQE